MSCSTDTFGYDWGCILNWKGKDTTGEVLSLLNGNRVGEFVKDVENVSSEGLICYYKSRYEKSAVQHLRIYRSEV